MDASGFSPDTVKFYGPWPACFYLLFFTQKCVQRRNQFIWRRTLVNEIRACLPGRGRVIGVHTEENDLQVRIRLLQQTAGVRRGGAVELPIQQEQIRRWVRQRAN